MGRINAMIATANAIAADDFSYVWGGGHAEAGVATHSGRLIGFDCSGSVAAVLAGAGLWPAGSPVPNDAGVIAQLRQERLIAPGPGNAPNAVTLYDHPGVHIFMNIDGRFFGTSDGAGGGSAKGGPSWLYDGAPDARDSAFKRYHLLPSVLHDSASYGHSLTFQVAKWQLVQGLRTGDKVKVSFRQRADGSLMATALTYAGAVTTTGTVLSVASDGSSVQLVTPAGPTLSVTLSAGLASSGLELGAQVQVVYTTSNGRLTARALTVTAGPAIAQIDGTVSAIGAGASSLTLSVSDGSTKTFSTNGDTSVLDGVQVGDGVEVSYVMVGPLLVAQQVDDSGPGDPGWQTSARSL
jgi:Cu/Ag efflux protein CusF